MASLLMTYFITSFKYMERSILKKQVNEKNNARRSGRHVGIKM